MFKKELRRCKREFWQNFCSRIEGVQESSKINRIFDRSPGGNLKMLRKSDGQWTTSLPEVYQHLLETHFPDSKSESESRPLHKINNMRCHKPGWLLSRSLYVLAKIVTVDRIKWAISTVSPFKSPERYEIFSVLLQKGIHYLADPFQSIYRAYLLLGHIYPSHGALLKSHLSLNLRNLITLQLKRLDLLA